MYDSPVTVLFLVSGATLTVVGAFARIRGALVGGYCLSTVATVLCWHALPPVGQVAVAGRTLGTIAWIGRRRVRALISEAR